MAEPAAGRVRAGAQGGDLHANGSLAASLDYCPGRFAQQRQVTVQQVGVGLHQVVQAVVLGGYFLALVENQRQITGQIRGVGQGGEGMRIAGGT